MGSVVSFMGKNYNIHAGLDHATLIMLSQLHREDMDSVNLLIHGLFYLRTARSQQSDNSEAA